MTFFYDLNKRLAALNSTSKQKIAEDGSWGMSEAWDTEMDTAEKDKGMFTGKTKAELQKQYNKLKASGPHEAGSDSNKKMKQLAFAIRAKGEGKKFGKVSEAMTDGKQFVDYVMSFYGPGGVYDMGVTEEDVVKATEIYKKKTDIPFDGDSVDRENVRDILTDKFGYEWVNESAEDTKKEYDSELTKGEIDIDRLKQLAHTFRKEHDSEQVKEAERADKDYDGDGEVESAKDEVWGSRAKAAAKAGTPFNEADVMSLEEEDIPTDASRELVLFADNDADLYRQSYEPIIKNLQRKVNKGVYDVELAKKLWTYHAERAAKAYAQEHGDGTPWNRMFSPSDRRAAAAQFEEQAREEIGAEEVAESQTDDAVHNFQDKHTSEKMKRLSNPRDYFESALKRGSVESDEESDEDVIDYLNRELADYDNTSVNEAKMKINPEDYKEMLAAISAIPKEKALAHKDKLKDDPRVKDLEKRFRWDLLHAAKVTPIIDRMYKYMNDDHIDTALKQIVKDAGYAGEAVEEDSLSVASPSNPIKMYSVNGLAESSVATKTKKKLMDPAKAIKHVVDPEQKKEVERYQTTGRLDPKKFKKKYLKTKFPEMDSNKEETDEQLSYTGEDATSRQYNGKGSKNAYNGMTFEDETSSSGGSISAKGGVTKHTAGGRYAALDVDAEDDDTPKKKKVPSGLGRGRPKKEREPEYSKMNDPFGRAPKSIPKGKRGEVHKMDEESKPDFLDMDKDGNKSEPMKKAVADKKGTKELDEKAVSKKQQKFMGMVHAAQKGEKPASKAVAKVAKSMGKQDAKDFAATKHKGLPEKVKEGDNVMKIDNTAGAKETQTEPGSNKMGFEFGKGIYEALDQQIETLIKRHQVNESLDVQMTRHDVDGQEQDGSVTVTASGEQADLLKDLLKNAGLVNYENDLISQQNTQNVEPQVAVISAQPESEFDVRDYCPVCDHVPCSCGDECGEEEISFELEEADVKVSDNEPDYPTNQETSDDAFQYSGGLNKPKSTGQTTIPVIASQLNRQHSMEESIDLERSLFKTWKNYKG